MKTMIFFREGLSGHYLKSIIDDDSKPIGFRVDPWFPGQTRGPMIREACKCLHPHTVDWQDYIQDYELILTIQVRQRIYHACYNNFYKKYLVENHHLVRDFENWTANQLFWYDVTYYNIKEYHGLYQQDLSQNQFANVIEFDRLLEADYIEHLLQHYYNRPMTDNQRRIVSQYAGVQLQRDLSQAHSSMQDIVNEIQDEDLLRSPWFASYCVFKYETNNGLTEDQRLWSIDNIDRPVDKDFLLSIANRYQSVI